MPELSNLLKNGLAKASQEAGVHPDADLLTAYAEQILTSSERSQVLEHLAACRQCRDVVSLALEPVAEEKAPVLVATPRRRWFLTPQFALVAAVAAMAVGVGIVMRLQPSQPPAVQEARAVPPAINSGSADSSPAQPGSTRSDSSQPSPAEKDARTTSSAAVPPPKGVPSFAGPTINNQKDAGTRSLQVEARNAPLKDIAGKAAASATGPASPANRAEPKKKDAGSGGQAQLASAAPSRQDYVNLQMFASDASYQGAAGGELPSAPAPAPAASSITQARALAGGPPTIFADIPN
ncbi:MAG: zf-HC2 domain-containing protein, partial [Terriglobales bacterium]